MKSASICIAMIGMGMGMGMAGHAAAQALPSFGVEAETSEARRGISWSEGRAALAADASVDVGAIDLSARAVTTRGAARHGGADSVFDVSVGTGWDLGGFRVRGYATGHLFTGAAGHMDYGEVGGEGSYSLGPAQVKAGASFAPPQSAIGGSNLYLYANANVGIPATPFTLSAGVGHSAGTVDDPNRAARLRPGGDYSDWRLGVEHTLAGLTIGVDYVGNDIDRRRVTSPYGEAGTVGDRLVGRVRLGF